MPTLQTVLLVGPVLLFSMVAHEIAHGYVALRQGDPTALEAGRLSWNPIRHIDPILTILLPLLMLWGSSAIGRGGFVIGGARPVPIVAANFRNPRRGDLLVSLAGVAANLLVAIVCVALIALVGIIGRQVDAAAPTLAILQAMFAYGVVMNGGLIAFNLLPVPPLDGSHVMTHLLPRPLARRYVQFGRFGLLALFGIMFLWPRGLELWLTPTQWAASSSLVMLSRHGLMLPTVKQWLQ